MQAPTPAPAAGQTRLDQIVGRIDRRIVYLGLFLITLAPLVFGWALPLYTTPPPKMLAAAIEALPTDKIVIVSSDWDAGTQAESRPQFIGVIRHLIRRRIRFAVLSISSPNAPQLANTAINEAVLLEKAEGQWKYGEHWANLGYKIASAPWLRAFTNDISAAIKDDWQGNPVDQVPVMKGVKKFGPDGQVSMLLDVTATSSIDSYIQYITPTHAKIGLACTAVMAPEQYPYLDSGQLAGMLTGMKGAAEYEQIIKAPGLGLPAMAGQSFAHLYIFFLILLGNISVLMRWMERRRAR
jgi:hypothetical protein